MTTFTQKIAAFLRGEFADPIIDEPTTEYLDAYPEVEIEMIRDAAIMPVRAHKTDAGIDLYAAEDIIIKPGRTVIVPTGLKFALPDEYEMQIRNRSGITVNTELRVQLGTVDAGYRGEVGIMVDNIRQKSMRVDVYGLSRALADIDAGRVIGVNTYLLEQTEFRLLTPKYESIPTELRYPEGTYIIRKGDKIAQAVVSKLDDFTLRLVDKLGDSERGDGGFGSTGTRKDGE